MKAVTCCFKLVQPTSLPAVTSSFPSAHYPFQLNELKFPLKRKRFYHKICRVFSTGCRRSQTSSSGSCAKCKTCKSLSYTAQDVTAAALGQGSCWNSSSFSERDISIELQNILNWKGLKNYQIQLSHCIPGFPFAELPPDLSCSNRAQALLCCDRNHCFPHDCLGMCFHSDITVG